MGSPTRPELGIPLQLLWRYTQGHIYNTMTLSHEVSRPCQAHCVERNQTLFI